jgi:hypothetical protein
MASPLSPAAKSLHEQAIECIIQATDAAVKNEQEQVKMHTRQAKMFAELTARKMRAMGMHRQADDYLKALSEHIKRVWVIAQRKQSEKSRELVEKAKHTVFKMRKTDVLMKCPCGCGRDIKKGCDCKDCEIEKEGACQCGYTDKSAKSEKKDLDLQKGFVNPFIDASPARKEYMQHGVVQPKWGLSPIKGDPKHNYKMMHELSEDQQTQVQQKFPQGNHLRYAYPVHKETGELVHAQRIPLPPGYAARAQAHAFKELKPEHRKGAFVRIHSIGHPSHGKKGVVTGHDPNMPGKIGVQLGPSAAHTIYVEPHQVKLTKPASKVEKAMVTLFNIRKAFMKSEGNGDDPAKNS